MYSSIEITNERAEANRSLPNNVKLERVAVATNILVTTKQNGNICLLLHNLDPVKLNQWYPFFVSHSAKHEFTSDRYDLILYEFESALITNGFDSSKRFSDGCKAIIEKIGKDISINDEKILFDEYWVKYSVAQEIWTMYLFEYYSLKIDIIDLCSILTDKQYVLLPLCDDKSNKWLETGEFLGIKIVDNIIKLLRDNSIRSKILSIFQDN